MRGAIITGGVSEWQIFQQEEGSAQIRVFGEWQKEDLSEENAQVYLCVKKEDSGEPVIWWQPCQMQGKEWEITLTLPAGGLYQIETCLGASKEQWSEWATRGDIVSHVGVGDLYVIAGQSNSAGYGKDYIYDPCEMGVHILKNSGKWNLAVHPLQDSTGSAEDPVNMDGANTGHSLYLAFAKYVKREVHYPIGLIQTAKGGTGIDEWSPENGPLYANMMERIRLAGGKVKAVLWYQGCSDALVELCESYYDKFVDFKDSIRRGLSDPALPFFVFQLNKCYNLRTENRDYCWGMIREQQRRLGYLDQIYTIPTTDSNTSDGCGHNSAKANIGLGERLAKKVLKYIYGKQILCDGPDVMAAEQTGDKEILLTFAPVYDKLETFWCTPDKMAFAAEDECGALEPESYECVGRDRILLRFHRSIRENCAVHCASDMDMQKMVPVDFATHIPVLSFYGVKVEKRGE